MASRGRSNPLDLITTLLLFIAGLAGLYQSMQFPARSGMWPKFVMVSLILFVGLHLVSLLRSARGTGQVDSANNDGPE
jgi:hypothetical protein